MATISSMTGFARAAGADAVYGWTWEARSVNGRGLDVRCRLPPGFDQIESAARAAATKRFSRGNVSLSLAVTRQAGRAQVRINRDVLDQLVALATELAGQVEAAPPRLDGLLALRGVIDVDEGIDEPAEVRAARDRAILAALDQALDALAGARAAEGATLVAALTAHLGEITDLTAAAAAHAATQAAAIKARLQAQLTELLGSDPPLSPERLAQEAAVMAVRADTREEIDRLRAHITAARSLLAERAAIGRKLEFLAQEFNREANTLCSKSTDIGLTNVGLSLKAAIDRLREQSANIE
jgi:uncharacterized protein (TIGR00255 family)